MEDEPNPFCFDEETFRQVSRLESSIRALDLDEQGEFIAIINAIEMQLESPRPALPVLTLLFEGLLALLEARHVDQRRLRPRIDALLSRLREQASRPGTR
jgi:hypothetical protein